MKTIDATHSGRLATAHFWLLLSAALALAGVPAGCSSSKLADETDNTNGDSDRGISLNVDGGSRPGRQKVGADKCEGPECQQVVCSNDGTTRVSGVVFDPAGRVPLYNVAVYIPKRPQEVVDPLAQGATCQTCESPVQGNPLVFAITDPAGQFTIQDAPAGDNVPLVIQIGKWRRMVTLPTIKPCTDNVIPIDPDPAKRFLRLPRNQQEGSLPRVAIVTGDADRLQCLFTRMGVAIHEFTNPELPGAVHLYNMNGISSYGPEAAMPGAYFPTVDKLWGNVDTMMKYDMIVVNCSGKASSSNPTAGDAPIRAPAQDAMVKYVEAGGKLFAEHYAWTFLRDFSSGKPDPNKPVPPPAPFGNVATWASDLNQYLPDNPHLSRVDMGFPKGQAFADWLEVVRASGNGKGTIMLDSQVKVTALDTIRGISQRWIYDPGASADASSMVHYLTFNAPLAQPAEKRCGRVVYTGVHVSSGNGSVDPKSPFPSCIDRELTAPEKALEFMVFDLSSCVSDDNSNPLNRIVY